MVPTSQMKFNEYVEEGDASEFATNGAGAVEEEKKSRFQRFISAVV